MIKKYRLCKKADFENVIKGKIRQKNNNYSIIAEKNQLDHIRIGISVSKKLGKAHLRVRVRRQIRSMIAQFDIYPCKLDVIIIAKPGFLTSSYQDNLKILKEMIDKIIL